MISMTEGAVEGVLLNEYLSPAFIKGRRFYRSIVEEEAIETLDELKIDKEGYSSAACDATNLSSSEESMPSLVSKTENRMYQKEDFKLAPKELRSRQNGSAASWPKVSLRSRQQNSGASLIASNKEQAITVATPASDDAIDSATPASDDAIDSATPASDEAINAANPVSEQAITLATPASDETINAAIAVSEQSTTVSATMLIPESETTALGTNEGLMLVKRQAVEDPADNCLIYRYGTFSTTINIVQGIESVEIVQISNMVPGSVAEMQQNAVDFTVTCQGSFPSEICTVVLDADCINPQQTDCSEVLPADECQLILRQFFNSSGTYCVNVSMTNAVSLAVVSARVDVNPSGTLSTTEALVLVGMMLIASIIGAVAITYRKYKEYAPLQQDPSRIHFEWISDRAAVNIFLRNMFGCQRSKVSENSPLLHGCVV
ncbi:uncharacterized protein LOC144672286 [Cetorhinus maximus]